MRIENEVKLDFSDVLIRPKRSTLSSRKEVSLERTYQFKHSNATWTGVPILAANMDGVGTFLCRDCNPLSSSRCVLGASDIWNKDHQIRRRWGGYSGSGINPLSTVGHRDLCYHL